MAAPLDLDQLQTFVAIADTGSFTRAADEVHRTQSAVSMQMRRLEERIGKPLFEKDGRSNRLTEEGERLLSYARRHDPSQPRDAGRLRRSPRSKARSASARPTTMPTASCPEIMARFARSNPRVELTVICEPTPGLVEHIKRGNLDLAMVTHNDARGQSEVVRREPLLWVSSANHATHEQEILPMAFGRPTCIWRRAACDVLDRMNRDYRVLFTSFSATVITAAVLSGLAISVLPECALRPGMRVLGDADGFGALPDCKIGIMRGHTSRPELVDALARHIAESLDNISVPADEENATFDFAAVAAMRSKRLRPGQVMPGW